MRRPAGIFASALLWSMPLWLLILSAFIPGGTLNVWTLIFSSLLLLNGALIALMTRQNPRPAALITAALFVIFIGFARYQGWLATGMSDYAALAACGAIAFTAYCAGSRSLQTEQIWQFMMLLGGVLAGYAVFQLGPFAKNAALLSVFTPAHVANLHAITALLALAEIARSCHRTSRISAPGWPRLVVSGLIIPGAVLILSLTALLMSGASAAIIALIIAMLVFLLLERITAGGLRLTLPGTLSGTLMILAVGGGVFLLAGDMLLPFYQSLGDQTAHLPRLLAYWDAVGIEPIFGHGLGGFPFANDLALSVENEGLLLGRESAGNLYLQWLIQTGAAGFAVMSLLILTGMIHLCAGLRGRHRNLSRLRAIIAVIVFFGLHGLVDDALEIPVYAWLASWLFGLGLGMAGARGRHG